MKPIVRYEYEVQVYAYESESPAYPVNPDVDTWSCREDALWEAKRKKDECAIYNPTYVVKLVEMKIEEQDLDIDSLIEKYIEKHIR